MAYEKQNTTKQKVYGEAQASLGKCEGRKQGKEGKVFSLRAEIEDTNTLVVSDRERREGGRIE